MQQPSQEKFYENVSRLHEHSLGSEPGKLGNGCKKLSRSDIWDHHRDRKKTMQCLADCCWFFWHNL